jgi:hypothetical protein
MLIGSRKLSLERLCSINEVVDELTPIDKLLSALKRQLKHKNTIMLNINHFQKKKE